MKTPITLVMLFIFSALTSWAQPAYTFKKSEETYTDLQNEVVMLSDTLYPNAIVVVPPAFRLFGHLLPDTLVLGRNGFMVGTGKEYSFAIDPFLVANTLPDTNSRVSVAMEGAVGQRILKVQWKNVGTASDSSLRYNYQCWLYEADQAVEFRFGPGSNPNKGYSGIFLLSPDFTQAYELFAMHGDPGAPTTSAIQALPLQSSPSSGTVYRMEYLRLNAEMPEQTSLQVYPNPGNNGFHLEGIAPVSVKVYDVKGQEVAVKQDGDTYVLDHAKPGLYRIVARDSENRTLSTTWMLR